MNITIIGRKVTIKNAFKERAEKKLEKLERYFEDDAQAFVTVSVEKERQIVEVTVKNKGMIYRAEETSKDMLVSFDDAVSALVRQINKNKTRLEKRLKAGAFEGAAAVEPEASYGEVRRKRFSVKPMSVDEAILQMNLLGHEFFTFLDEESEIISVVYKRSGGGYGVLEPSVG
jgi:ribosomal subunit interface protein